MRARERKRERERERERESLKDRTVKKTDEIRTTKEGANNVDGVQEQNKVLKIGKWMQEMTKVIKGKKTKNMNRQL